MVAWQVRFHDEAGRQLTVRGRPYTTTMEVEGVMAASSVPSKNVAFVLELLGREIQRLSGDQLEQVLQLVEFEEHRRIRERAVVSRPRVNRPMEG